MAFIDYMKVIDIISMLFETAQKPEVSAIHDKVDYFDVNLTLPNESLLTYKLVLHKNELEIILARKYFSEKSFEKWVSRLEYELEQLFMRNIRLEIRDETINYNIKILS